MTETATSTPRTLTFPEDHNHRPCHESRAECSECGGEGRVEVYRMARDPGGSWDTPYHDVQCDVCKGAGWHTIERCAICRRPSEHYPGVDEPECECDDEIETFQAQRATVLSLIERAASLRRDARTLDVNIHPSIHDVPLGMVLHIAESISVRREAWRNSNGFYIVADIPAAAGGHVTIFSKHAERLPEWDADDKDFPRRRAYS